MVPRTKQLLSHVIPYCKCEVAKEMLNTIYSPYSIGAQNQFGIGPTGWLDTRLARGAECGQEIFASIDPSIRDDPGFAIQRQRLRIAFGFFGGFEQRMAKSDIVLDPRLLIVGTTKNEEISKLA